MALEPRAFVFLKLLFYTQPAAGFAGFRAAPGVLGLGVDDSLLSSYGP